MVDISTVLKELELPEKWERIESPTMYNGEIVPFDKNKVESELGFYQNGNIIYRSHDNSIKWVNMTIANSEHVKCFEARFDSKGSFINLDINYFNLGGENNIYDEEYINLAIDEVVEYIRNNKERFTII